MKSPNSFGNSKFKNTDVSRNNEKSKEETKGGKEQESTTDRHEIKSTFNFWTFH